MNAPVSIDIIESGMLIFSKLEQPLNAFSGITVTLSGIAIDVMFVFINVLAGIAFTFSERIISPLRISPST